MGAPIIPSKHHNLKIFGWDPSLGLTLLFSKYKTNGDVINLKGQPKPLPNIENR